MSAPAHSSHRTHRHSSSGHAICKVDRCRCSFSGTKPQVVKHEVQEHLLRRFFCCACPKTLSSFESLRTHANSQHFRNTLFKCETCHTTYLDPARLAKCRKRQRGQFRCPELGCTYHHALKNSVLRHVKVQHHRDADDDDIPFDTELSSTEPPKMRRVGSSSSASGSSSPGSLDSLLGHLESRGPSDDELFRLSEEKRRVLMERTRKEHAKWMGGEDALKAAVPDYPIWTRREYPYGRAPSVEPEPSKQEPQEPVDPFVPTTTTQAWYGGSLTYPDPLLPNCTAPILPYQLSSPTTVSSGLEWGIPPPPGALSSSPPLAPPYEQFYSPETPYNDNFLATLSGTSSNSIYSSQSLDDAASSDLSVLGVLPQAHLIQNITPELYFDLTFPKWTSR